MEKELTHKDSSCQQEKTLTNEARNKFEVDRIKIDVRLAEI